MAATKLVSKPLMKGGFVYVKYLDHSWFRNADPERVAPIVQEAWGRLDKDEPDHISLVAATYIEPGLKQGEGRRVTALAIVRSTILELRRLD